MYDKSLTVITIHALRRLFRAIYIILKRPRGSLLYTKREPNCGLFKI